MSHLKINVEHAEVSRTARVKPSHLDNVVLLVVRCKYCISSNAIYIHVLTVYQIVPTCMGKKIYT